MTEANQFNSRKSSFTYWNLLFAVLVSSAIVLVGCGGGGGGGSSSGSSGSDSDTTQTFSWEGTFDTFEDGEYTDEWTVQKKQSEVTASVTSNRPYQQQRSLEVNVGSTGSSDFQIAHDFSESLEDGHRLSTWLYPNSPGAKLIFEVRNSTGDGYARIRFPATGSDVQWGTDQNNLQSSNVLVPGYDASRWYRLIVEVHPGEDTVEFMVKDQFGNTWSTGKKAATVTFDRVRFLAKDYSGNYTTYLDYTSLEPYFDLEPNEDRSEATSVGTLNEQVELSSQFIESAEEDWYEFDLPVDGDTDSDVRLLFTDAEGDLNLELYDGDTLITSSQSGTDVESISLDGLTADTYFVRVYSPSGETNAYQLELEPPSDLDTPQAPSSLSGTVESTSRIDLSWTDNSGNEDYFRVVRTNPDGSTNKTQVDAITTSFSSTGLSSRTSYAYYVKACNSAGCSSESNTITKTTESSANTPSAPSNLSGTVVSSSQINLSWKDNSNNEEYFYMVRRNPDGTTNESQKNVNTTTYSSTGLSPGMRYDYYVKACNSDGCSSKTNTISRMTYGEKEAWRMFSNTPDNRSVTGSEADIQVPNVKWTFSNSVRGQFGCDPENSLLYTTSSPVVTELQDGRNVVIAVGYKKIYCFNASGDILWSVSGTTMVSTPAIGDINSDGEKEFVLGGGNKVVAFNCSNGDNIWSFSTGDQVYSSPVVGDFDEGHKGIEIAVGSRDGFYLIDGSTGNRIDYIAGSEVDSSPAVGDIDSDGDSDVVFGGDYGTIRAYDAEGGILPENLWSFSNRAGEDIKSSPAVADIGKDGDADVVCGSNDGNVYAVDGSTGNLLWSFNTGDKVISSPAIGDCNSDGDLEVVIGSGGEGVYAIHARTGNLVWKHRFPSRDFVVSSPSLGDVNGDGTLDVLVGSTFGPSLHALSGKSGDQIWKYEADRCSISSPAIADLDEDGSAEIVLSTTLGGFDLYVLE